MPGYNQSEDEIAFWQGQAALLDPDAYEFLIGTSQSRTVTSGERWFLVNAWYVQASGGGVSLFHRPLDFRDALPLAEGRTLTTDASNAGASMYLCKPSLVTGSDSRYVDDPRQLFFERYERIADLTQYTIGVTRTDTGNGTATFPTDFTDGLLIHTATHDLAWTIMLHSGEAGGMNTHNEISDDSRIRFAQPTIVPFKRTTFPKIKVQGVGEAEGRATVTYLKLPSDW